MAALAAAVVIVASTTGAAAQSAASGGSDQTLVYAMYADIKDWDPSTSASTEVILLANVYEPLVRYVPGAAKDNLVPALATAWKSSKGGKEWIFTLRKGVKFHDGSAFDSSVAKASIERTIRLARGSSYIWGAVSSMETPDPLTLVIRTRTPAAIDLIASAQYAAYMISPRAMAAAPDWFNQGNDGGSGPYQVRKWIRGQEVVLERFEGYRGGWKPGQFRQVNLRVVQEAGTQTQLLRSGEADFITIPSADVVLALARDPNIEVVRAPSWRNVQLLLNTQKPPTSNLAFRRALAHAWDYRSVVDGVYDHAAQVATGLVPGSMWGHETALKAPRFDLEAARRLLAESGVPREQWKITAAYVSSEEEYKNMLLIFQANLAKIGVTLELKPGPWGKIWDDAKSLQSAANMISMTWWPSYATPSDWLIGLFRTETPTVFNLSHYSNAQYDQLVNAGVALEAVDRAAAIGKYSQAQQVLVDDAAAIFVADLNGRVIYRRSVRGVVFNPACEAIDFYSLTRS